MKTTPIHLATFPRARWQCAAAPLASLVAVTFFTAPVRAALLPNGNPTGPISAWDPVSQLSVNLKPNPAVFIPQGSCPWLIPALTNTAQPYNQGANDVWKYSYASLSGDLNLLNYRATAGGGNFEVDFNLGYSPKGSDPTGANVRWVQVIDAVFPSPRGAALGSAIGTTTAYMDNARDSVDSPPGSDPYYGWLSVTNGTAAHDFLNGTLAGSQFANGTGFFDGPGGAFGGFWKQGQDWEAQVFPTTETDTVNAGVTTHNVTIYDGVWWGFTIVPEPGSVSLLALGTVALLLARRRHAGPGKGC